MFAVREIAVHAVNHNDLCKGATTTDSTHCSNVIVRGGDGSWGREKRINRRTEDVSEKGECRGKYIKEEVM